MNLWNSSIWSSYFAFEFVEICCFLIGDEIESLTLPLGISVSLKEN